MRFYLTYEELKHEIDSPKTPERPCRFYLTYEELKLFRRCHPHKDRRRFYLTYEELKPLKQATKH